MSVEKIKKTAPLVSIIIPAYNAEDFVAKAIDSCVKQTYPNIEIIAVDDGSADGTLSVLQSFKDERLKIVQRKNGGPSAARNSGLKCVDGEYLLYLDADDFISFDYVEKLVDTALMRPDIDIFENNYSIVYPGRRAKYVRRNSGEMQSFSQIDGLFLLLANQNPFRFKPSFAHVVWNKFFKIKSIAVLFDESTSAAEDFLYLVDILASEKKIMQIDVPGYSHTAGNTVFDYSSNKLQSDRITHTNQYLDSAKDKKSRYKKRALRNVYIMNMLRYKYLKDDIDIYRGPIEHVKTRLLNEFTIPFYARAIGALIEFCYRRPRAS